MGNLVSSIIFFHVADEYRSSQMNLNNYLLMKDNEKIVNEKEINDLILQVNNEIEFEKLENRLHLLKFDDNNISINDNHNHNNNNNDNHNNNTILVNKIKKPLKGNF
jgi:hypothetical protein